MRCFMTLGGGVDSLSVTVVSTVAFPPAFVYLGDAENTRPLNGCQATTTLATQPGSYGILSNCSSFSGVDHPSLISAESALVITLIFRYIKYIAVWISSRKG